MIMSTEDYIYYLKADKIALDIRKKRPGRWGDEVWEFQRLLRKCEYTRNCCKGLYAKIHLKYLMSLYNNLSIKLCFTIPLNVFGPGLSIAHRGTIVINSYARILK